MDNTVKEHILNELADGRTEIEFARPECSVGEIVRNVSRVLKEAGFRQGFRISTRDDKVTIIVSGGNE